MMTRREVLAALTAAAATACSGGGDGRAPSSSDPAGFVFDPQKPGLDKGQKAPPLPPDLNLWAWDAGGFVGDPIWYGEHDWDGVRMRLMGHLVWLGRDRCRLAARRSGLPEARAELVQTVRDLGTCAPQRRGTVTSELHSALKDVVQRDLMLLDGLAGKPVPTGVDAAGVFGIVLAGGSPSGLLERLAHPPKDLDLDNFKNFDDRHRLRVQQWIAWGAMADPLGLVPTWGHFDRNAWTLWHRSLVERAGALRSAKSPEARLHALAQDAVATPVIPTLRELGALPTGDSLIDTAGEPGPQAIGELWTMGAKDTDYQRWLGVQSEQLKAQVAGDPDGVVATIRSAVAAVDRHTHGSRFYNIKQLRNAGVRALASRGHFTQARLLLADHRPLHNQDWACPNRAGILQAIEGRVALTAGTDDAQALLHAASQASRAFTEDVNQASQNPAHGLRPPGFGHRGKSPPR